MKLYFDSLTTLEVIHAESLIVIFFGTYGREASSLYWIFGYLERSEQNKTNLKILIIHLILHIY